MDTNNVVITGRLVRDPEFSKTTNDKSICKFSIACNGFKKDDVSFLDIVCWGKTAEIVSEYLRKGSQSIITGRLQQQRFQDKSGANRSKIEIVASAVQFIGPKSESGGNSPAPKKEQSNPDPFQHPDDPAFENIDFNDENEIPF